MPVQQTIEQCIERADELAQEVVNAWGMNVQAVNSKDLTEDFKALFEITCRYRTARETADNHRQFNLLSAADAAKEKTCREEFARAYKEFKEKSGL